jgi:DNA-binding transcriptional MerR regulator
MDSKHLIASSEIERETGFGKEQLRKWRQRFKFPPVDLTAEGKPAYSRETVNQLLLIKRLLEAGFRPGQVVGRTAIELEKLLQAMTQSAPEVCRDESTQAFIEKLKQIDMIGFLALLAEERSKRSLLGFVRETVAPLLAGIGDAWTRHDIEIHHEHLCTSSIERYLHSQILPLKPKEGAPSILLALPPGERHVLGLLMAEAVMAEHGARTTSVSSDIPMNNLGLAVSASNVDVVALSFSFSYSARDLIPTLLHLRRLIPNQIQIWAGGAGVAGVKRPPKGVRIFRDFDEVLVALDNFGVWQQ